MDDDRFVDVYRRRMAQRRADELELGERDARERSVRRSLMVWAFAVFLAFAFGAASIALDCLFR